MRLESYREDDGPETGMSSNMEAVGRLAAGIAHDFNNLLTPILGNLSIAREELEASSLTLQLIEEALTAGSRAKQLSDQLLAFSQDGAPVLEACDTGRLVSECAALCLQGETIQGEVALAEDLWALRVDADQISQALGHLLINAVEALAPEGGLIRLRAFNQAESEGQFVRIEVSDEGPGIAPDDLRHIFEPFYSTRPGRRGIGLARVRSIVRQHGGRVTVASSLGQGATFQLILPACPRPKELPRYVPLNGKRFLLVDEEAAVRRVFRRMLERLGVSVEEAGEPAQAVYLYQAARRAGKPFDLVVLDQTLRGGMGGAYILSRLRKIDRGVVAVVASGYFSESLANYRDWGFRAAIRKPFVLDDLRRTFQTVLADSPAGRSGERPVSAS